MSIQSFLTYLGLLFVNALFAAELCDCVPGDVNQDKRVTGADSLLINQVLVGLRPPIVTGVFPCEVDVTQDTAITITGIGFRTGEVYSAWVSYNGVVTNSFVGLVRISAYEISGILPALAGIDTNTFTSFTGTVYVVSGSNVLQSFAKVIEDP